VADNVAITPGSGAFAACDEVTYSGDSAKVQIVRFVHVEGSEGSKTLTEICDATDGLTVNLGANNDVTVSGSVAVTNAGITTVAGAVAGSEMQVDVVAALPAGDAAIGRVKLTDGTDVADVLDLTNANPLTVAIVDGSGDQITSFGGGTQYTEGATDATITGTALLWEDTSDTLVTASAAKPFPVEIVAGAGSGGTAAADDADFTAGTTSGTPAMGVYESTPTSVTDGDLGTIGITQTRALRTAVEGTVTVAAHAVTNAGVFAVQVDGNALTALQLIDDVIYVDDADWTDNTSKHALVGGVYQSAPHTVTDGDVSPFLTDVNGRLATVVSGTVAVSNAGLTALAAAISTEVQCDIVGALPAGTNAIGKLAANSGVDIGDVDVTSISAGSNLIGDVAIQGRTTGGLSIFLSIDLDESEEEVKATAGTLYAIHAVNLASTVRYLKFYNDTTANVTVGTTTPVLSLPIPAATNKAGFTWNIPQGLAFSTAITAAATTGVAHSDTGAPGANEVVINLGYK
jgi:hypothetical protein